MFAGFSALVGFLTVLYFVLSQPVPPDGDYHLRALGKSSQHIVFKDGEIYRTSPGFTNALIGNYYQTGGRWISAVKPGYTNLLLPTLLSIAIVDPETKQWQEVFPRSGTYWLFLVKVYVGEPVRNFFNRPPGTTAYP
jgi:hypothetical protein